MPSQSSDPEPFVLFGRIIQEYYERNGSKYNVKIQLQPFEASNKRVLMSNKTYVEGEVIHKSNHDYKNFQVNDDIWLLATRDERAENTYNETTIPFDPYVLGHWDVRGIAKTESDLLDLAKRCGWTNAISLDSIPPLRGNGRVLQHNDKQDGSTQPTPDRPFDWFKIPDGSVGCGYNRVLEEFLDKEFESVRVEDPWIWNLQQVENFFLFCILLAKNSEKLNQITLITSTRGHANDPATNSNQWTNINQVAILVNYECFDRRKWLDVLKRSLIGKGIALHIFYNEDLHDRQIDFGNDWTVIIGRGLDYFKPPKNSSSGDDPYMNLRSCMETTITIIRHKKVAKADELKKELDAIRSLMGNITPNIVDLIIKLFRDFKVSTDENLADQAAKIVLDKAIAEPELARLCAMLCKSQIEEDLKSNSGGTQSPFHNSIMRHLGKIFEKDDELLEELCKKVQKEEHPWKKGKLESEEKERCQKLRRIKVDAINFIEQSDLLRQLSNRLVGRCVQEVFKLAPIKGSNSYDNEAVSCVIKLLNAAGGAIQRNPGDLGPDWLKSYLKKLESIQKEKRVSSPVQDMIMNLLSLAKNWQPKVTQEQGPEKLEEVPKQPEDEKNAGKVSEDANRAEPSSSETTSFGAVTRPPHGSHGTPSGWNHNPPAAQQGSSRGTTPNASSQGKACYNCGDVGHMSRNCPRKSGGGGSGGKR